MTRSPVLMLLTALAVVVSALIVARPAAAAYEFDGRRGREVVVGVPGAEAVVVVPGSVDGPQPDRAQRLDYGSILRSGDVNGDGYDDVVVANAGEFGPPFVVPGSRHGLREGQTYPIDAPEGAEDFGDSLLVADVDRDGFDDAVVGYWRDADVVDTVARGAGGMHRHIAVVWGAADGVGSDGAAEIASPKPSDASLLLAGVGNVVGDRRRDLVVVAPGAQHPEEQPHHDGAMMLCEFGNDRDAECGDPITVPYGYRDLVVGDFVGGNRADIVLYQDYDGESRLHVYRATPHGLAPAVVVTQSSPGVPGSDERGDAFGAALAAADVDRDGKTDLAVGAPGENNGAGRVTLLYGNRVGLGHGRDRTVSQQTPGVPGRDERRDGFGGAVALVDVDGNRAADLVVGAPGENRGSGAVTIVRATAGGRLAPRAATSLLRPRDIGVDGNPGHPQQSARMGASLGR